ncbi:MAG: hypothetical protein DRJ52_09350 [Thermoprotei archaeon]|nr:MAG: hypothetical protein DRJ52_09350 [Thermoprotei archaeon]RLE97917.1 MAG: hypothetical protein DRJ63_08450 [Thermoprotei archaeon]
MIYHETVLAAIIGITLATSFNNYFPYLSWRLRATEHYGYYLTKINIEKILGRRFKVIIIEFKEEFSTSDVERVKRPVGLY